MRSLPDNLLAPFCGAKVVLERSGVSRPSVRWRMDEGHGNTKKGTFGRRSAISGQNGIGQASANSRTAASDESQPKPDRQFPALIGLNTDGICNRPKSDARQTSLRPRQRDSAMSAAVHVMAPSGLRGYGRHFPLSHPAKEFFDIIIRTCGMGVRLKLNHCRPEDCGHEALHARPIDAARI